MRFCFVDYTCPACRRTYEAEFENTTPDVCPNALACETPDCGGTMRKRPGIPAPIGVMPSNEEIRNRTIGLKPGDAGYTSAGSAQFDKVMEDRGLRTTNEAEVLVQEDRMRSQLATIEAAKRESRRNDGDPSSLHKVAEQKRAEDMDDLLSAKTRAAGGSGAKLQEATKVALATAAQESLPAPFQADLHRRSESWEEASPGLGRAMREAEVRGSTRLSNWLDHKSA
jgi:hypothetical protein